ncbi:hypothetical protein HMPREF1991_02494 [Hoylesella loescheii DSM 19665 = JCM 12249 = ATCC 15930]|uniref:Uncharacterized protein n=1 Tax=Hoylesella loescheii DSM 19665 = JCM 12249 = ATCC 15930 TaxID=1122985 RepID=A0A069QF17_HOYLO|nr:hypothetical protein HMPREF1991_02494 [Hoylesella loescheii DSM 19665 = JCM 12249 = ATCC 15930]
MYVLPTPDFTKRQGNVIYTPLNLPTNERYNIVICNALLV